MSWYKLQGDELTLNLMVQPGAKATEIIGVHGDFLKVRIQAQPTDGQANEALLKWVAKLLHVPLSNVSIKRGLQSRRKTLLVKNCKPGNEVFILSSE